MRILIIGTAGRSFKTENYIRRAFLRAGHQVFWYNDKRMRRMLGKGTRTALLLYAKALSPDFVLLTHAKGLDSKTAELLCKNRTTAMWYFDMRSEIPPHLLRIAKHVDTFYVTNRQWLEELEQKGVRKALFLPQACDDRIHRYYPCSPLKYDLSFVGSAYGWEHRLNLIKDLGKHFDVHVWGKSNKEPIEGATCHQEPLFNKKLARVIGASFGLLGTNGNPEFNQYDSYSSNRVWLTLGCGGFFLGYKAKGMDSVVKGGTYCEYYETANELIDKLRYYKKNPQKREDIRLRGYNWVHANHTYDQRIENLLSRKEYSPCNE